MNILFIVEYYHPHTGGVETFFKSLAEELDLSGHQVTIITNRYDSSLPKLEKQGKGITVKRHRFYNRYLFTFGAWWYALKEARKADIIHTTSFNAAVPARMAAKLTSTKAIITFHEVWDNLWFQLPWMSKFSARLHRLFEKWICSFRFDKFVGVSDFTKNALINSGIPTDKVMRIYNGIRYPARVKYTGSSKDDPFTFLFFGRVSYSKGTDILIPAIKKLNESNSSFRLVMIIPSEDTTITRDIRSLIKMNRLESVIIQLNDLTYDELEQQIAKADTVVIPSYSEGFCFAAVETMAIGTPIISSGRGALSEVVNGTYIELDSLNADDLAIAMRNAMNGFWTITEQRQFPIEDTIREYLKLYQQIIDNKKL